MAEKTFDCNFHVNVNSAWCGSAYLINHRTNKTMVYSYAAVPYGKANVSKATIKVELEARSAALADEGWTRVSREEMDAFKKSHK